MKKTIILSVLTLFICMGAFANSSHHSPRKKSHTAVSKQGQTIQAALPICRLDIDFAETCCDGSTLITAFAQITFDCSTGEVTDIFAFADPNGCGFLCA